MAKKMTPAEAEAIFYEAIKRGYQEADDARERVIQRKVDLAAWASVVHAIRAETERELLKEMAEKGIFSGQK